MTTSAIQDAWKKLRDGKSMKRPSDAAKCRSESDWLVGLNSTRALTCFRSRHGGFKITAAGRVQTPTLAILAKREREIAAFNSQEYWEVHADFEVSKGLYIGRWFDPNFSKMMLRNNNVRSVYGQVNPQTKLKNRCKNKTGIILDENKPSKQIAPQLYDLTTLQKEAPFTAKNTLGIAQALYERHKMITYPRTDSRYLPEDYLKNVQTTTSELAKSAHAVAPCAKSIENDNIVFNKRIFNNKKVSDHFAIIPIGRQVKLTNQEAKVYI